MKTSQTQFDLMVTYMEQHGDLSKPSSNARGRVSTIECWEELKTQLNSDSTGDTKTTEKWKKVWSDFKSNTKKKAAKLHQAARGTGGGPALHAKLSDLEARVIAIVGMQAATGLGGVNEAGFTQQQNSPTTPATAVQSVPTVAELVQIPETDFEGTLAHHLVIEEDNTSTEQIVDAMPSTPAPVPSHSEAPHHTSSPRQHRTTPSPSGHTPRRRGSHRRVVRRARTHVEEATQNFINSDNEWRQFKLQQHRDWVEAEREKRRIRERELQVQRDWQELGNKALVLLEKYVNKNN